MSDRSTIDALTLQAYIDGELPETERAAIEDAVGRDPVLAEQIAQYGADKSRIAEMYGRIRVEPVPAKWIELIETHPIKSRARFSPQDIAAIAAALLITIEWFPGISGRSRGRNRSSRRLLRRAVKLFPCVRRSLSQPPTQARRITRSPQHLRCESGRPICREWVIRSAKCEFTMTCRAENR